jgi:hypothetical protein
MNSKVKEALINSIKKSNPSTVVEWTKSQFLEKNTNEKEDTPEWRQSVIDRINQFG